MFGLCLTLCFDLNRLLELEKLFKLANHQPPLPLFGRCAPACAKTLKVHNSCNKALRVRGLWGEWLAERWLASCGLSVRWMRKLLSFQLKLTLPLPPVPSFTSLPLSHLSQQAAGCRLQVTGCRLQVAYLEA